MPFFLTKTVVLTLVLTAGATSEQSHEQRNAGDQTWSVSYAASDAELLPSLREQLDVLSETAGELSAIVRSHELQHSADLLEGVGLQHRVLVHDVAQHLQLKEQQQQQARDARAVESCTAESCPRPFLEEYMTWQQVEWFLQELVTQFPDEVKLVEQGKTEEGRNIYLVKVTAATTARRSRKGRPNRPTTAASTAGRKAIFVEGGAHAREWISPATVLNLLMSQVEKCAAKVDCDYEYYFMPLINPDGYEYTWTTDRYWRKNRSVNPGSSCTGTDLNRNWGFKWAHVGSSSNPCSDVYHGSAAFSEAETAAVRDALALITDDTDLTLALYLSYHSYGQAVLYPWGYTTKRISDRRQLKMAGEVYKSAIIASGGLSYTVMNAAGFYPAAGASDDYAKNEGAEIVFTVELRGLQDFVLPASEIQPTYAENWAAFVQMQYYM